MRILGTILSFLFFLLLASIPILGGLGGRPANEGDLGLLLRCLPLALLFINPFVLQFILVNKKVTYWGFIGLVEFVFYIEMYVFYYMWHVLFGIHATPKFLVTLNQIYLAIIPIHILIFFIVLKKFKVPFWTFMEYIAYLLPFIITFIFMILINIH